MEPTAILRTGTKIKTHFRPVPASLAAHPATLDFTQNIMPQKQYFKSFFRSYALRVSVNIIFLFIVHWVMISDVENLPEFHINIIETHDNPEVFYNLSGYLFDETAILITLGGLIVVALMALLVSLGFFRIIPDEKFLIFRIRLFIYTITNLAICCITTLYLFFLAAIMISISSYRISIENGFIWLYPFYAMVIIFYLIEIYGFLTINHKHT